MRETYKIFIEDVYVKKVDVKINKRQKISVKLDLLDTAGQSEYLVNKDICKNSLIDWLTDLDIESAHAIVMVYSVVSMQTFQYLDYYYDKICRIKQDHQGLPNPPIVLVGNKMDLKEGRMVAS